MRRVIAATILISFAAFTNGQSKSPTPAEQYKAIVKEYQTAASGGDGTDDGRRKVIARVDAMREGLAQKFLDLAEKHPTDPIAVDALGQAIWMVNNNAFPAGGKDSAGGKAMAILLRAYVEDPRLGPICQRINSGFREEYEPFLRQVLEKNPNKNAQGLACLSLAQYLNNRMQRLDEIHDQPELAKEYARLFGKNYVEALRQKDRAKDAKEIEALFERARDEFASEKIPYSGTIAAKAKAELFEFRNLLVGKMAPDMEGPDQDGKQFKLSEYRGKVVLIDFWNEF